MNNVAIPQNPAQLSAINEALRKIVQDVVAGKINDATARCSLKNAIVAAGYHPGTAHVEPHGPEDLLWDSRINLVLETNVAVAQNAGWWQQGQNEAVLDELPAQELFRAEDRIKRRDWLYRFQLAGSQTGDSIGTGWTITPEGRMIALKNHPIWDELGSSDLFDDGLDYPFPPFAFSSGMNVRDVDRALAQKFGLVHKDTKMNLRDTTISSRFMPIEDLRVTEYLWNEPLTCDHCGAEKPKKLLSICGECGETICPDCKAKGCAGPEPPPPPRSAMQCFSTAVEKMMGRELPLGKDVAEEVLQWCDRAFEFGFAAHLRYFEARAYRMRAEAFESLGQKDRALLEYELAVEKDPQVGVKKRIVSLRKELTRS